MVVYGEQLKADNGLLLNGDDGNNSSVKQRGGNMCIVIRNSKYIFVCFDLSIDHFGID